MKVTRYLQIENIRFTYQELTQLCRFHQKNNFFTSLFYSSSFLFNHTSCIVQPYFVSLSSKCQLFHARPILDNTKRLTFRFDFEVVLYVSNSILYSAQSQELLPALENEFELNKLIFHAEILVLVSYSGEM